MFKAILKMFRKKPVPETPCKSGWSVSDGLNRLASACDKWQDEILAPVVLKEAGIYVLEEYDEKLVDVVMSLVRKA